MVGERLFNANDQGGAVGIGLVGIVGRDRPALDARVAVDVRIVDEEDAVRGVVGMEGHAEQALFATAADLVRDVEERRLRHVAVAQNQDRSALIDDEDATAVVAGVDDLEGPAEARDHLFHPDGEGTGIELGRRRTAALGREQAGDGQADKPTGARSVDCVHDPLPSIGLSQRTVRIEPVFSPTRTMRQRIQRVVRSGQ